MRNILLIILFSLSAITLSAQDNKQGIPDADKELLSNIHRIMLLPEGTHKIYNGTGNTVFDVLYTIEISKNKWVVYKGGTQNYFDIIYSVEHSDGKYKIYKGSSDSVFNVIYTIKETGKGFEIYKGDSVAPYDLLYSYERN